MIKNKNYRRLVLALVLIVSLFVSTLTVTYAWFVEVKRTRPVYFKVGEIEYEYTSQNINDSFVDDTIIVPGMDLIVENESVAVYNKSTISSELRILIDVSYTIKGTNYRHIIGDVSDDSGGKRLLYEMATAKDDELWKWDYGDDGFWYFYETDDSSILPYVDPGGNAREIKILDSLKLNGDYFGNDVSAKNIVIKFTFQAKQSSYAEWNDVQWKELGTITQTIN